MKKTFTILMALMVLCFTQCKPTPESGDDNAPKVRVSCEIPMNDGSKSDFTNLMTNGKINWSNGRECVYVAIHGNNPQIIELVSYADGNPSKLEFTGEAAKGLITSGEEYDIWYFGHSQQLDAPYFNNNGTTLTGSIANQSGRLSDLGYCHIAKTKVKATTENDGVRLNLSGVFNHQIAIALLDLNNVTELYGDAIVGTEYALECTGGRYELNVVENNNAKINVESASGISYVVLLPNENNETNIKIKRGGNTYAYTFHNSIKANKVYYRTALDGTPEALPWSEIEEEPETHEYVDLGLPSGLLWATCNMGASSPEDYGDYYAWGETSTNNGCYTEDNCSTFLVLYSELQAQGYIDGEGNLTSLYDAATVNWGSEWRMPTSNEFNELRDCCTWTWTMQNGVNGYKVTGPNGKNIFMPAAGWHDETSLSDAGYYGYYWSSVPNYMMSVCAWYFVLGEDGKGMLDTGGRCYGYSVRPVSEPEAPNANGREYVDLGLSVNWATCNVGAEFPEEYGDYYAWGETTTKDTYDDDNSATHKLSHSELQSQGYIDENDNLTLPHDAARANWGGDWRMPTQTELDELMNECVWTQAEQNGVKGCKVTGPNGNSIFLPFAGEIDGGSVVFYEGSFGTYWSSTYSNDNPYYDQIVDEFDYYIGSYGFTCQNYGFIYNEILEYSSYYGLTIRPVIRK